MSLENCRIVKYDDFNDNLELSYEGKEVSYQNNISPYSFVYFKVLFILFHRPIDQSNYICAYIPDYLYIFNN